MSRTIEWHTDSLDLDLVVNESGVVHLRSLRPHGTKPVVSQSDIFTHSDIPLVSIRLVGEGNTGHKTSKSLVGSYVSARLRCHNHDIQSNVDSDVLIVHCVDEATNIRVSTNLTICKGIPVLRASATVTNESKSTDVVLSQISSLTIGGMTTGSKEWYYDYSLFTATNGWFRDAQWREHHLPDIAIDDYGISQLPEHHPTSNANFSLASQGSFSTGTYLPMGLLKTKDNSDSWLWQIEHNGSWRWEIGDFKDSIYLAAGGPTAVDHAFRQVLRPGESFTSVPVACCRVRGGLDAAFAALTDYRRAILRPHHDNDNLPIIFNDYMNCLMGDPDEEKIKALLDPVSRSGAEYFVIDAGWYSDDVDWWDDVGLWEPSKRRFPSGFKELLETIKRHGLTPGLWIEPEVVGVRSIMAKRLPEDAFFQECGHRVLAKGRYQLDYRHPQVREWITSVITGLIENYGVGYFKFDYNIEVIQGTDLDSKSSGVAHLEHRRAYLDWVRGLLDRYPDLVIENCSSGAQRMDYAMLSIHPIQSTSDQQDPVLYAAIAAAVPTAVVPEQSATWAYPQPEWDDEINALTVINSLLGRIHLSGRLDTLSSTQYDLVHDGMKVYKTIRQDLRSAHPAWPLGLPKWHDDWICMAMVSQNNGIYLSVWRRGGPTEIELPLSMLNTSAVTTRCLYPTSFEAECTWDGGTQTLKVKLPNRVCARLFHISSSS